MQQIFRNGWKIFSERRDAWITFSRESKQRLPPWFRGEGRERGGSGEGVVVVHVGEKTQLLHNISWIPDSYFPPDDRNGASFSALAAWIRH